MIIKLLPPTTGLPRLLRYCLDQETHPGAAIGDSSMLGRTVDELIGEFAWVARLRSECALPVYHCIVSYAPTDRRLSQDVRTTIARQVLQDGLGIDLGAHDVIRVSHGERRHPHDHILVNRVGRDGRLWTAPWAAMRILGPLATGMEERHGLRRLDRVPRPDRLLLRQGSRVGETVMGYRTPGRLACLAAVTAAVAEIRSVGRQGVPALDALAEGLDRCGYLLGVHHRPDGRVIGHSVSERGTDGLPRKGPSGREWTWSASSLGFRNACSLTRLLSLPGHIQAGRGQLVRPQTLDQVSIIDHDRPTPER